MTAARETEADSSRNLETCLFKVLGGDARNGRRVLESTGVHPASPITVERMAQKFVTDRGSVSLKSFDKYKEQLKQCKVPRVEEKVVGKLVGGLKDCKASGISGWRNSRLKAIASTPEGLRAISAWVKIWVAGKVPDGMAKMWKSVLGIPLKKGDDGMDVRPILVGEALVSLPGAFL